MRIHPHYTTKEQLDRINTTNYTKYPVKKPAIPTPIFDLPPPIELGDPRAFDHPKKELIRTLVIDPDKREEAKKAAQLEKESGAKETPITDALIKTTAAHESAMSATTVAESEAIAEVTAELVVTEEVKKKKRLLISKTAKHPMLMVALGVFLTIIVFKLLPQQ